MTRRYVVHATVVALALAAIGLGITRPTPAAAPERTATQAGQQLAQARAQARAQRARADHLQQLLTRRVKEARSLRAQLLHQPSTIEALRLAATSSSTSPGEQHAMYRTLYRLAACESRGITGRKLAATPEHTAINPHAKNPNGEGATGAFQYLPSTWATTRYGRAGVSIWNVQAQALATVELIKAGQLRSQWECAWAVTR